MRIVLASVALCLVVAPVWSQATREARYTDFFYRSGNLRIQAYLYEPDGEGPFPVVIYNHGSRVGREPISMPQEFIGGMLTRAGYVVLVPERRGYGKSDGGTSSPDFEYSSSAVLQLEREADDVIAALDHLRTLPFVDVKRIGIMGWSYGGIVTMFAVSRSPAFAAAIDQAGGALVWNRNPAMRSALTAAARKATTPTLFQVAENDNTTASITTLADIFKKRGVPHRLVIYASWVSPLSGLARGSGHSLFREEGATIWAKDVLEFLGRYLGP